MRMHLLNVHHCSGAWPVCVCIFLLYYFYYIMSLAYLSMCPPSLSDRLLHLDQTVLYVPWYTKNQCSECFLLLYHHCHSWHHCASEMENSWNCTRHYNSKANKVKYSPMYPSLPFGTCWQQIPQANPLFCVVCVC